MNQNTLNYALRNELSGSLELLIQMFTLSQKANKGDLILDFNDCV